MLCPRPHKLVNTSAKSSQQCVVKLLPLSARQRLGSCLAMARQKPVCVEPLKLACFPQGCATCSRHRRSSICQMAVGSVVSGLHPTLQPRGPAGVPSSNSKGWKLAICTCESYKTPLGYLRGCVTEEQLGLAGLAGHSSKRGQLIEGLALLGLLAPEWRQPTTLPSSLTLRAATPLPALDSFPHLEHTSTWECLCPTPRTSLTLLLKPSCLSLQVGQLPLGARIKDDTELAGYTTC